MTSPSLHLPPINVVVCDDPHGVLILANQIVLKLLMAMNIGIAAILIDVVYELASTVIKDFKVYAIIVILAVFFAAYFNVNIILIIFLGGLSGYLYFMRRFKAFSKKEEA